MSLYMFSCVVMGIYVAITFYLSYIGMRKTTSLKSFALGNKDMSPYLIGMTMAASISSTATFVINPGFVYSHGLSAYLHYAVAASLGIITAFVLLSRKFRSIGASQGSLTIPHWINSRYKNEKLALFFAVMNLLSITFIVLILVGCGIIMSGMFGISQHTSLILVLLFVFSYVLMGGTYAHAYTNSMQGFMMMVIALVLFFSGLKYWNSGFLDQLQAVSANFAAVYNPESSLYNSFFSVFFSGFIITFALMFQPHILTKVLYIKDDRDVNKFLITTVVVGVVFSLILFVGFYAKFSGLEIARQDAVVKNYILHEFGSSSGGKYFTVIIFVSLLAAGMSTLDGILVALSAMVVNDIYRPLRGDKFDPKTGLALSRYVLVGIGLISFALAWNPPALVGLFAQKGVYGLAAASFVPIAFGVMYRGYMPVWIISISACIGLFGHLLLNMVGNVYNPSVSSAIAILASVGFAFVALLLHRSFSPANAQLEKPSARLG